jgi:hypothetical protein
MRSLLYSLARLLGDWNAVASGDPKRIARRIGNKVIGRTIVRRLWL